MIQKIYYNEDPNGFSLVYKNGIYSNEKTYFRKSDGWTRLMIETVVELLNELCIINNS